MSHLPSFTITVSSLSTCHSSLLFIYLRKLTNICTHCSTMSYISMLSRLLCVLYIIHCVVYIHAYVVYMCYMYVCILNICIYLILMDICGYDLQHHLSVKLTDFDFADLGARAFCVWRERESRGRNLNWLTHSGNRHDYSTEEKFKFFLIKAIYSFHFERF